MTTRQARAFSLRILSAWQRDTVWLVKHRVSGETCERWFKSENAAKQWSSIIADATIEMVQHRPGKCPDYDFAEDQRHEPERL
jgi:hypothetical protein